MPQFAAMAGYQAWLGDAASAIGWLQRAADISPMVHYWHLESGLFDRVRRDTTFTAGLAAHGKRHSHTGSPTRGANWAGGWNDAAAGAR